MAWPPPTLPTNRTDATVQQGTHPADHNAANLAINDTVTKVAAIDGKLVGAGSGGLGYVGRLYTGLVPSATVAAGTQAQVAYIDLPAGLFLVTYFVLLSSTASIKAGVKAFGADGANPIVFTFRPGDVIGTVAWSFTSHGAGRLTINVDNSGTAAVACYSDAVNHQLFATGLVLP